MEPRTPCMSCLVLAQQENVLAENIYFLQNSWKFTGKLKKNHCPRERRAFASPDSPFPISCRQRDSR